MAEKLSDKLKSLFKRADTYLGKAVSKTGTTASYPAKFEQTAFKAGQKTRNLFTGKKKATVLSKGKSLIPYDPKKSLPATASKLKKVGKLARLSRIATPIGLASIAGEAIYKTARPSKEAKAKIKAAKKKMSKITTKQAHADLFKNSAKTGKMMKASLGLLAMRKAKQKGAKGIELLSPTAMATKFFNKGGETMLKGKQKKLDKDGDGKISGNDFKMMKKVAGGAAIKGMGAARTSGMGLQDENLIPGKSMDYYKDIV